MRELPILFNAEMVRALLDGRKTQTRRICKLDTANFDYDLKDKDYGPFLQNEYGDSINVKKLSPYQPGDILYVRETWKCVKYDSTDGYLSYGVEFKDGTRKYFEFDDNERFHQFGKFAFKDGWQPSMFMPKEAARIWLTVTDVRVERLKEITAQDAKAEGMFEPYIASETGYETEMRGQFRDLWDSLNAKHGYGWDSDPWVFVYTFERTQPYD